ncbi:hypothetical protein PG994_013431 [Apiospora phragmitis]|uniref:EthD domain-containing protein n=1 Tax=Apiospora phragmitis TaxID=2905665 RepID=A0ABR1TB56_9PEZI
MVYSIMVFAGRKAGFKARYEQHMQLVKEICGDAMPLRHTRTYLARAADGDQPLLLMGKPEAMHYDVVAQIFEDEAGWKRFTAALAAEEASARIKADEDGFWGREGTKVVVVGEVNEWAK